MFAHFDGAFPDRDLSQLTRGKQAASRGCCVAARLIPTHAGKTNARTRSSLVQRAHPRSCRENSPMGSSWRYTSGSSPLMRGKRQDAVRLLVTVRLIPAHTGKTTKGPRSSASWWAHPRSCGENRTDDCHKITKRDSSPLMRGKLEGVRVATGHSGLIPAHEGKTRRATKRAARLRAHPRSCGENVRCGVCQVPSTGSSPLTRGKHLSEGGRAGRVGLIPAHAGKTSPPRTRRADPWAHPRSRGENWGAW